MQFKQWKFASGKAEEKQLWIRAVVDMNMDIHGRAGSLQSTVYSCLEYASTLLMDSHMYYA